MVAIRAEDREAGNAGGKFVHRLPHHQALITPNAKILLAAVMQSKHVPSEDSERRKAAFRPQRACVNLTSEQQARKNEAETKRMKAMAKAEFMV